VDRQILTPTLVTPMVEYPPGWTCELIELRLAYYVSSTLPLGEALAVAEHVEACTCCAQRLVLCRPTSGEAGGTRGGR
jgi:hypothetical protein